MLDFSGIRVGNEYSRTWLANEWRFKGYQAFAKGVFCPRGGGQIILFVTKEKQKSQEQYEDSINGDQLLWEGEKGHLNDERVINSQANGEEIRLFYRDHYRDAFEYKGLVEFKSVKRFTEKSSKFVLKLLETHGKNR